MLGGGGEKGLEEVEIDELVAMREHRRRTKKRCSLELQGSDTIKKVISFLRIIFDSYISLFSNRSIYRLQGQLL